MQHTDFKKHLILGLLATGPCLVWAQSSLTQRYIEQNHIRTGRESFVRNCSGCHGIQADGKGESASMLNPKPRNLATGAFKFRSTPSGTLPTTADLIRTLNVGIPGTSMPSFHSIPETEKLALAMYIKSLRKDWKELEGESLPIPAPPKNIFTDKTVFLSSAARGHELFVAACHTCHGEWGLGDGPDSAGLTDADGLPIKPGNISNTVLKSGRTARDVFRLISTGLDGTPMPGFVDTYSVEQRWDLVAYVFFRRGQRLGLYPEGKQPKELVAKSSAQTSSSQKSASQEEDWK